MDIGKPKELSQTPLYYSNYIITKPMPYAYTAPLPGLANWYAFVFKVFKPVKLCLR